jgi:hypothetical protein
MNQQRSVELNQKENMKINQYLDKKYLSSINAN